MIVETKFHILKLKNALDIVEIKQILFATEFKKAFKFINPLKVILRQVSLSIFL